MCVISLCTRGALDTWSRGRSTAALGGNLKRLAYFGVGSLCVVAIASAGAWLVWRYETDRLMVTESIEREVGLSLPSGVRIAAARAHVFSLADGDNYEWLVESEVSLLPWARANMTPERGGWEHIDRLSELGHFGGKISPEVKFGGVWRGVAARRDGREETSYLYLAQDGRVGILSTFRP